MWIKWLPWKYIVSRLARSHGFTDPIALLSHFRRFSEPSEVAEPIELLRAGVVLHARGLINSRVIQHNLDWVWPYWVNQQFDPRSKAFIPRAFSLTHINLSARNWTSVGIPGFSMYPIVAPRGLVMPFWDSWSIDAWIITDSGELLAPSRLEENIKQKLVYKENVSVKTTSETKTLFLQNEASVNFVDSEYVCCINVSASAKSPAFLVISARPYNPEGVSFIHTIYFHKESVRWRINDKHNAFLSVMPDRQVMSNYRDGDVLLKLLSSEEEQTKITCDVGMATSAAMYRLEPEEERSIEIRVPLHKAKLHNTDNRDFSGNQIWHEALEGTCNLTLPYRNFQYLYDAAIRSVILHSPREVYPGPFTYRRFWFRDAAFIIYAIISVGMIKRAEKLIDNFLHRQTAFGYFHSQEGEWDSNGQVLWLMNKFCRLSGRSLKAQWIKPVINGAKWIAHKRTLKDSKKPHAGLLPAGFSAEHLGPNDYYYWDDFWSVAGLQAASQMLDETEHKKDAALFADDARDLLASIEKSLDSCSQSLGTSAMPASPYRRLDSGMIGSLSSCYPLEIFKPDNDRTRKSAKYIMDTCMINNGFFHDISHSGINAYLTLDLAQVLMRMKDSRFIELVKSVANLASPTGQWPEAINPRTGLGCMGDGQHVWASAEWIMMMINSFVMRQNEKLVIGAGVFSEWLDTKNKLSVGPVMTGWGPVSIEIQADKNNITVHWEGKWRRDKPAIEVRLPGYQPVAGDSNNTSVEIKRMENL